MERRGIPRLTVVGSGNPPRESTRIAQAVKDGTAAIAGGGAVAGGFGVEAVKAVITGEKPGPWWFVAGCVLGLAFVALGFRLRSRATGNVEVGIVAAAADPRRVLDRYRLLTQQAETFGRNTCVMTLKTEIHLPDDGIWDREIVDALADQTLAAAALAEGVTPDATQTNLFPIMPLHVAFWFGARLGHTHAQRITAYATKGDDGTSSFFAANPLRVVESTVKPLAAEPLEPVEGGDPTKVALAVDLQGLGRSFSEQVKRTCRQDGIGYLIELRLMESGSEKLTTDTETFSGVVEQICRTWRDAPLPSAARTGQHAIFLSGPASIAVALGARLASQQRGAWTAYTFDSRANTYEPLPAPPTLTPDTA
ncbi:SAVED domain-containing protein [Rhizohabitans arisaemae]|uniref:SAVED domain-containing protein n=1 Tax=Rhizohabitans arisaemae TaxID=2720610 RepID=UPI0024B0D6F2|nr:SAVED domain-containing protein [Rhizohabitans arisaemae]